MKSISEIYEEFVNIRIEDIYEISKKYKELYKELYKEGDIEIDKIRKEEESEYADREYKITKRLILAHNFEVLFFKEVVPKVLKVYNQYEGKRIGEKTSDKIRNEVCQKLDTYPFSKQVSVSVYEKGISYNLLTGGYQTASFRYDTKSEKFFTLRNEECKLNHLDISMFCIPRKEYVEGIGAFVKEKEAIAKEIADLSQKLGTAINRFNTNLPTGFREADHNIDKGFYFRTK